VHYLDNKVIVTIDARCNHEKLKNVSKYNEYLEAFGCNLTGRTSIKALLPAASSINISPCKYEYF